MQLEFAASLDALHASVLERPDYAIRTVSPGRGDGGAWAGWLSRKQDVMHRLAASATT